MIENYQLIPLIALLFVAWVLTMPKAGASEVLTVQVTWDIPTQRENGSTLNAEEIKGYRVYSILPGNIELAPLFVSQPSATATLLKSSGDYCFQVSTVDSNNLESKRSDKYCMEYVQAAPGSDDPRRPKPPDGFEIRIHIENW